MKILVTGGTGFTGSHLTRRLLEQGHEVSVLDSQAGLFFDELRDKGAAIRIGSVGDADVVDEMVRDCEVVHHLAAAFRELNASDKHYYRINVEGTRFIGDACEKFGVRKLVYCSTQGVHGNITSPPGNEESPIAPEDYYQQTKYEGEQALREHMDRGLDVTILRPTAIYGPGDPARFLMLFRMVRKGRFLMFGDGKTFYHPVHISNLVDAFDLASATDSGISGEAYIIGDEQYWSLNDLVRLVGQSTGIDPKIVHLPFWPIYAGAIVCEFACKPFRISPPLFRRRVNWFRQDRAFSIDKASAQLGYRPRIGIQEGLAETARWYEENGYL